jgi:hypothetical protein
MMKVPLLLVLAVGCAQGKWLDDAHILVDGYDETNNDCRTGLCPHDENTDLTVFDGATYLVHRTAISQVLGPNSSLRVSRSDDHGKTWSLLAIIPAPTDRDLRDPSFFVIGGQLAIKAITRLPHTSSRDSDVDSISIVTVSPDGGMTWGPLAPAGPPTWSFWRVKQDTDGTYYSAAYEDGDLSVKLFSSTDGVTWQPGTVLYDVSADTPVETELVFGDAGVTAFVRVDGTDDELLGASGRLRTIVCTSPRPYTAFDCSHVLDGVRLDGPVAFEHAGRTFVIARKHLPGVSNKKRTALYELAGDDFSILERGVFPSAGDTSYAGVAPIDGSHFLVTYYSSNIIEDGPWARAMLEATDIWQATIDLDAI